jgi:regulator of protease activity HflC (stomatin/prohibitin superfamily)
MIPAPAGLEKSGSLVAPHLFQQWGSDRPNLKPPILRLDRASGPPSFLLQEIMNRVLGAERVSEAQLVEARTKAEVQKIEAQAKADAQRLQAQTEAEVALTNARSAADATRLAVQAEMEALEERRKMASAYSEHPALLRLEELTTLRQLARNANARLYLDFKAKPGIDDRDD